MWSAACFCGKHLDAGSSVCCSDTQTCHSVCFLSFVSTWSDAVLGISAFGGLVVLRVSASIHHWLTALFQLQNASDYSKYLSCNFLSILGIFFVPINTLQSVCLRYRRFLSLVPRVVNKLSCFQLILGSTNHPQRIKQQQDEENRSFMKWKLYKLFFSTYVLWGNTTSKQHKDQDNMSKLLCLLVISARQKTKRPLVIYENDWWNWNNYWMNEHIYAPSGWRID